MKNIPKIKLTHLLTKPNEDREKKSISQLQELSKLSANLDYYQVINEPYVDEPPKHNVIFNRSDWVVGKTKPYCSFGLISGHYGCYLAHVNIIKKFFEDDDHDFLIIAECDCKIKVDYEYMISKINFACEILKKSNHKMFSFVHPTDQFVFCENIDEDIILGHTIICTHLYMIHKKDKDFYKKIFSSYGWHAWDWWINFVFEKENEKILCYKNANLTSQFEGASQIDRIE